MSTLSCDTRFRHKSDNTDYICPKEKCPRNKYDVFGTYYYSSDSKVCRAAWHDGRILPWSDNEADRTVRWTTCTRRSMFLLSFRYGAGQTYGYAYPWDCKKFVSERKFESLYRLSTLSSVGSGTVRVYGGNNVDLATDVISASVYDTTDSTASPPTQVLPGNAVEYKEYRIHTGVNVFTTTGNKTNLYSRIVNINYGNIALSGADQSSTLKLVNSSSLTWTAEAAKAIDGSRSTDFMKGTSCSHTLKRNNLQNPWLRVALNRNHSVHGIEVTSRNGSHDCKNTQLGKDYMGTVNQDNAGHTCRKWNDSRRPHLHALENYCRNPDAKSGGPWCFHAVGVWGYCDVSLCSDLTESLRDFQVRVSNRSDTPPEISKDVVCRHYTGTISDATTVYIACDRPVTGRYIYVIKNGNSKSETLSLCEVKVWGKPASAASSTLTTRASVGDGITVTFEGIESSGIRWQKDGIGFYSSGDLVGWNDKLSNTISRVEVAHGGVYSIYRPTGIVLGITRLVVRVCPRDKYGVNCTENCPQCENGGICHDITGECICPPGFMGHICSIGCGGNRFGSDCLSNCSEVDSEDGCRGKHVCTIDPYGCSCVAGFKGMTCSEECQEGYYGADCQQACGHCINNTICNPYTGICRDSCAPGYITFPYCQTECPAGWYGSNCQHACGHCSNGAACNRSTGVCVGACEPGYMVFPLCKHEIARLKDRPAVMTRTRTTVSVRWTAWQSGTDHGVGPVKKYIIEYEQDGGGVWTSTEVDNVANQATFTYNISNTDMSHFYLVRIRIMLAGGLLGNASPEVEACGEPQAPEPSLSNTVINAVNVNWPEADWRCGTPGWYVVEYINGTDTTWQRTSRITSSNTSLYTALCTTWQIRVRVFNKHMSSLSCEKNITSQSKALSAPPQDANVIVTWSSSLYFSWSGVECVKQNGQISSYRYQVRNSNGPCVEAKNCVNETDIRNVTLVKLTPYSTYELRVQAIVGKQAGPWTAWTIVTTNQSVPTAPKSVMVIERSPGSVTLSWSAPCPPRGLIVGYMVQYQSLNRSEPALTSVCNNCTRMSLQNLHSNELYEFKVRAKTIDWGEWSSSIFEKTNMVIDYNIVGAVCGFLAFIVLVAILGFLFHRKRRRGHETPKSETKTEGHCDEPGRSRRLHQNLVPAMEMSTIDNNKPNENDAPNTYETVTDDRPTSNVYEKMEPAYWVIPYNSIVFDEVVGKGSFGDVQSATIAKDGASVKVALKRLNACATDKDKTDFIGDLNILSQLGSHANVISLIGACEYEDVLFVATEYASKGNLRTFLRDSRMDSDYANVGSMTSLSEKQLLQMALDVSRGMKHLAAFKIIHRDLAARNVLVSENLTAKISDFGLSRNEDIYVKQSQTRVAIRWMSPESLFDHSCTTKSDVWSFGILLWEIVTLGGTPYSGIPSSDLLVMLKSGYGMPQPCNCSDDVYELMTSCWSEAPRQRPTFNVLVAMLEDMLVQRKTFISVKCGNDFLYEIIDTEKDDQ